MIPMCFKEVVVWSDKDVAFWRFSIVKRVFLFTLLFCTILVLILQYLTFLKICKYALTLARYQWIKLTNVGSVLLQWKILKNIKEKGSFELGKVVSNLCKYAGKHMMQLLIVVPFSIILADESL